MKYFEQNVIFSMDLIFRRSPTELLRIKKSSFRQFLEFFDDRFDRLLAVDFVVSRTDVDGLVRLLLLADN